MHKQVINQVRLYTNPDQTVTVAFFNHGRYFRFIANNSTVTSIDLAITTLFVKHTTNNVITLSDYNSSLEDTQIAA
jgi:hypothetical protein